MPLPLGAPALGCPCPWVLSTEHLPLRARWGVGGGAGLGCFLALQLPGLDRPSLSLSLPFPACPPQAAQSSSTLSLALAPGHPQAGGGDVPPIPLGWACSPRTPHRSLGFGPTPWLSTDPQKLWGMGASSGQMSEPQALPDALLPQQQLPWPWVHPASTLATSALLPGPSGTGLCPAPSCCPADLTRSRQIKATCAP